MEKRFFVALLLSGLVLVVTPMIFSPARPPVVPVRADSAAGAAQPEPASAPTTAPPAAIRAAEPRAAGAPAPTASKPAETISTVTPGNTYSFTTGGAAPTAIEIAGYPALNGGKGNVVLRRGGEPLLRYQVIAGKDTIALDRTVYTASRQELAGGGSAVSFTGTAGTAQVRIDYEFTKEYRGTARIAVSGASEPAFLLVGLPTGFDTQEADTVEDIRHLSYAVKPVQRAARGIPFTKLNGGEHLLEPGPLSWAVAKNKYFLIGLLAPEGGTPFAEAHLASLVSGAKLPSRASAAVVVPLVGGKATLELYAGPQSWQRLHALGREFETANPYGGFMQPVVQPFATIVMRAMLWLKQQINLNYGWVLVLFGVAVRLLMWPLNQSAMRSSLRLQRIQPELQAVQAKHKGDPAKQQQELMRVYAEHGMSPFSAFSGCLPALLPMPVFFALFFVFQNTIEFRGVPFLWLHDISLRDPLFVLPVLTGASMFVMSWIGMRGAPPNPQMQTMLYVMPAMFVVFLINTASGLSIYYLVQNLAAIPQQWMIANERRKAAPRT